MAGCEVLSRLIGAESWNYQQFSHSLSTGSARGGPQVSPLPPWQLEVHQAGSAPEPPCVTGTAPLAPRTLTPWVQQFPPVMYLLLVMKQGPHQQTNPRPHSPTSVKWHLEEVLNQYPPWCLDKHPWWGANGQMSAGISPLGSALSQVLHLFGT